MKWSYCLTAFRSFDLTYNSFELKRQYFAVLVPFSFTISNVTCSLGLKLKKLMCVYLQSILSFFRDISKNNLISVFRGERQKLMSLWPSIPVSLWGSRWVLLCESVTLRSVMNNNICCEMSKNFVEKNRTHYFGAFIILLRSLSLRRSLLNESIKIISIFELMNKNTTLIT